MALKDQIKDWPDDVQRAQALGIVEDAVRRSDGFTEGGLIKPGD